MIDLHSIQHSILRHPLYRAEVPYTLQLGLPQLSIDCEDVYLQFRPHRILKQGAGLVFFPPEFSFIFLCPFQKLVAFSNLRCAFGARGRDWDVPICSLENALKAGIPDRFNALWKACEYALADWVESGRTGQIADYCRTFERVTSELGIATIYR